MRTMILLLTAAPLLLAVPRAVPAEEQRPEVRQRTTFDLNDLGALCDGHRDDTRAIQSWLDRLENTCG